VQEQVAPSFVARIPLDRYQPGDEATAIGDEYFLALSHDVQERREPGLEL
jgi:hypothetical protein